MNLQYAGFPLCVNTVSCYTRKERKGQRLSFSLPSSFNDHSLFQKCSLSVPLQSFVLFQPILCLDPATYSPVLSFIKLKTLFYFCLLPRNCCLSDSVHAEQLGECSSKNRINKTLAVSLVSSNKAKPWKNLGFIITHCPSLSAREGGTRKKKTHKSQSLLLFQIIVITQET